MAIFKSDPTKILRRDIDAAKANRDRLSAKLAETEAAIIERRSAAQALARDGADDATLEKAEAAIRAAQDRASTIAGALTDVVQQLTTLEQTQIENSERKLRSETATEVAAMAVDLEQAGASYDIAVSALSAIAGRAAMFIPDAMGLEAFAVSSREQVPPAVELVAALLRNHADAVLNGSAAATLRKAEPPAPRQPTPATENIWVVKPIACRQEGFGQVRIVDQDNQIDLPPALARKAISLGAAVPVGHKRWGISTSWRRAQGYGGPDLKICVRLDDETEAAPTREKSPEQFRVLHSSVDPNFEVVDRGPTYTLKTNGPEAA